MKDIILFLHSMPGVSVPTSVEEYFWAKIFRLASTHPHLLILLWDNIFFEMHTCKLISVLQLTLLSVY